MFEKFRKALEWFGHFETINAILHIEFVRTLLLPTLVAAMTGTAGFIGNIPLMWVIMATALAFMGTAQGMLRASEYVERKNPLNKLVYVGTHFGFVLTPAPLPQPAPTGNRHQRRATGTAVVLAQILSANEINPSVPRAIREGQISVEVKNIASFPISCILHNAITEVAGHTPPRSVFPKPATTVQPGGSVRIPDALMNLNDIPCGDIVGKMDMIIKYGLPGKEHFELRLTGDLTIGMFPFGMLQHVATSWTR